MSTGLLASLEEPSPYLPIKSQSLRLITQVESKANCEVHSLGHSPEISEDGLLVLTSDTIEPSSEVIVRFHLPPYPGGHFIEAEGVVVRVQPSKFMAIQFTDLKYWDRRAIETFVQQGRVAAV